MDNIYNATIEVRYQRIVDFARSECITTIKFTGILSEPYIKQHIKNHVDDKISKVINFKVKDQ